MAKTSLEYNECFFMEIEKSIHHIIVLSSHFFQTKQWTFHKEHLPEAQI